MDAALLDELEGMAEWRHLRRGELLWEQETTGDALYLVISGRLRTVRIEKDGAAKVLGESGRGAIAGEMAFFGCEPRGERVEAVRDAVLVGFTRDEFDGWWPAGRRSSARSRGWSSTGWAGGAHVRPRGG